MQHHQYMKSTFSIIFRPQVYKYKNCLLLKTKYIHGSSIPTELFKYNSLFHEDHDYPIHLSFPQKTYFNQDKLQVY